MKSLFILPLLLVFSTGLYAESSKSKEWQSPLTVEGTTRISTEEAWDHYNKGTPFIDVRNDRYFNKRHIPGAHHLYVKSGFTEENLLKIAKKDEPVVLYCNGAHCSLSYKAATKAVAWGFTGILYFRDGFRSWRLAGHPFEIPEKK